MRARRRWLLAIVAAAVCGLAVAMWPARRLVAVNRVVYEERLPAWVKAVDFLDRDLNFRRVADAAIGHVTGDEARTMAALRWTRDNVLPQPPPLPSRDDHPWYIIVRGYGEADQQADVFTTLLTYEDVPAYWMLIGVKPKELALSYVKIGGEWRVFDVANGISFRRLDGALATPDDIAANTSIVESAARGVVSDVAAYLRYFRGYRPPAAPDVLRADMQMPGRRIVYELKALVGRGGRVWTIRPYDTVAAQGVSR